jgi:DNA-binding NarL/FixJ family response regulator
LKIKVLIADDHQLFREGLINLLSESPDIDLIGYADNGKDAYEKAVIYNPNVILMDISMPVMGGEEATRLVKKQIPAIKIIALTMHSDKHYIKSMLEAGVDGYLFKNCTYNQLIEAIKTVVSGKKYLSGDITETLIDDYLNQETGKESEDSDLTERELEVLKLYAEGKTTREISETLFVSIKTVGTHRQHIMEKLDIKTTVEMIKYALRKGIISLD